ncbi:MAG: hypothetical protein KDA91_14945, partial [Planctomycetaceae bacterium]|nr:hypothetical protein [Planctomycetaceae bacterium]
VLLKVLSDRNRFIDVRCRAAYAIARTGSSLNGNAFGAQQLDLEPIAWKIVQLARETAQYFNAAPANPAFVGCGENLYLSFHHLNSAELSAGVGLLNRAPRSQYVNDAYKEALKIAAPMMFEKKPIAGGALQGVDGWINNNKPATMQYDRTRNDAVVVP